MPGDVKTGFTAAREKNTAGDEFYGETLKRAVAGVAAKKELFNLRFQNATNQLENTSRIKEVRKNIARIQTVITEQANASK